MGKDIKEIQINDILGFTTIHDTNIQFGTVMCIYAILSSENKEEEGMLIYRVIPINRPNISYIDVSSNYIKSHYIKQ